MILDRAEWVYGIGGEGGTSPVRRFVRVTSSSWPSKCGPLVYVPAFQAIVTSVGSVAGMAQWVAFEFGGLFLIISITQVSGQIC